MREGVQRQSHHAVYQEVTSSVRALFAIAVVAVTFVGYAAAESQTHSEVAALIYGKKLIRAVVDANADQVKQLIDLGADVNLRDEEGRTPLILAVQYHQPDVIDMLLLAGADPTLTNNDGRAALDFALFGRMESENDEDVKSADRYDQTAKFLRDEVLPIWEKAHKEEQERLKKVQEKLQEDEARRRSALWDCLTVEFRFLGERVVTSRPPRARIDWEHKFNNSCAHDIFVVWNGSWWGTMVLRSQ